MYVSEVYTVKPTSFKNELQMKVYEKLDELNISFERVDCEDGTTMESCKYIDEALKAKTVKTLFLCNRQKTMFYLYVMEGDKPFITKEFSSALEISRTSFAPEDMLMEKMGTRIGATTCLSFLLDSSENVKLVFDKSVLEGESICCTDGTHTGFIKINTDDLKSIFNNIEKEYAII